MPAKKPAAPSVVSLPRMELDPNQPGIIRFPDVDPFAGMLAGVRAPAIVAACNAHDELVVALRRIADHDNHMITGPGRKQADSMTEIARAALAKVEGLR